MAISESSQLILVGVVGNISACHADAPGSIPGRGVFFCTIEKFVQTMFCKNGRKENVCTFLFSGAIAVFFVSQ